MRRIMLLCGMIAVTVSGCTYVNNKSWDDMTPEEQEEVRQVFEEERKRVRRGRKHVRQWLCAVYP